jgi:hypothetical protein
MFDFVASQYFSETIHLGIVVGNRKIRRALFSKNGDDFKLTPGATNGNPSLGAPVKLVLFAWSTDHVPVTARFSEPTITPLLGPQG